MLEQLTFITGNAGKARQVSQYLGIPVLHKKMEIPEIQSLDAREVVEYKAKEAYRLVGTPVLVQDIALTFHALGRLPGALIKWFLSELGNEGLTRLLDGYADRSSTAEVFFCRYDGTVPQIFQAAISGRIADKPRGDGGFGWDPIFIPEGCEQTWGEMTEEQQAKTSIARQALLKLQAEFGR